MLTIDLLFLLLLTRAGFQRKDLGPKGEDTQPDQGHAARRQETQDSNRGSPAPKSDLLIPVLSLLPLCLGRASRKGMWKEVRLLPAGTINTGSLLFPFGVP